jgi:hypothetical protein
MKEEVKFFKEPKYNREVVAINFTAKTMLTVNDDGASSSITHIPPEYFMLNYNAMQVHLMHEISETWFQTVRLSALMKISRDIHSPRPLAVA